MKRRWRAEKGEDQLSSYFINVEEVPRPFRGGMQGGRSARALATGREMYVQTGRLHGEADPLVSRDVHVYLHMQAQNTTFRGMEASIFPSCLSEVVGWIPTVPILSLATERPDSCIFSYISKLTDRSRRGN